VQIGCLKPCPAAATRSKDYFAAA